MSPPSTAIVSNVRIRRVLNSHLNWTYEATVALSDGRFGRGACPRGETRSIYEDRGTDSAARRDAWPSIIDALVGRWFGQASLDSVLVARRSEWGADVAYALSTAFYEAIRCHPPAPAGAADDATHSGKLGSRRRRPRLLFNLLNGGLHAYTNPIASDLTEILLVSRTDDLEESIDGYRRMLAAARIALVGTPLVRVGGNLVHDLGGASNEAPLALVHDLLEQEGLAGMFGLMLDASAGDWWDGHRYRPPVSGRVFDPAALVDEWMGLLDRFELQMLEDPLAETDIAAWGALHDARPPGTSLMGDNLTSTDPSELQRKVRLVDGVLLKPDQNGTVTGTEAFAALARAAGILVVASHRSIETESLFLVHLAVELDIDYVKVGPYSDFSSVMRTNELLRQAPS